jgi:exoribonuclease-2
VASFPGQPGVGHFGLAVSEYTHSTAPNRRYPDLVTQRIGQEFDGVMAGASARGTWVRIFEPPVEGRVERGQEGLDVGDRARVRLVHTNPERGFIDFVRL